MEFWVLDVLAMADEAGRWQFDSSAHTEPLRAKMQECVQEERIKATKHILERGERRRLPPKTIRHVNQEFDQPS